MATTTVSVDVQVQTKSLGELETRLSEINEELKDLKLGEEAFKALSQEAAGLTKAINKANEAAEGFTDEKKFQAADGAIKLFAGSLQSVVGVLGTIGVESEVFGEFEKKAASAIAVGIGLKDFSEGFKQIKDSAVLANVAIKANEVATKAAAATMKLFGVTVNTTSKAFRGLRAAIAATGIGLLVVGVGVLVEKLSNLKNTTDDAGESIKKFTDNYQDLFKDIENASSDRIRKLEVQIELERQRGESQNKQAQASIKISKLQRQIEDERLDALASKYTEVGQEILRVQSRLRNDTELTSEQRAELIEEETNLYRIQRDTTQQIAEEENQQRINGIKARTEEITTERQLVAERKAIFQELTAARSDSYINQKKKVDDFYDNLITRAKEAQMAEQELEDFTAQVEEERTVAQDALQKVYQAAAIENEVNFQATLQGIRGEAAEARIIQLENTLGGEMAALQSSYDLEVQMLTDRLANEQQLLQASYLAGELSYAQYQEALTAINEREKEQRLAVDRAYNQEALNLQVMLVQQEVELAMMRTNVAFQAGEAIVGFLSEVFEESKGLAIAAVIIEKAGAIAQIIANTAIANAKLIAAFPVTLGQPWVGINTFGAAASILTTTMQAGKAIKQIQNAGSSTSAGGPSGMNLPTPQAPPAPSNIQERAPQQLQATPMTRTYVLTGDITSGQEAQAKLNTKRTIS